MQKKQSSCWDSRTLGTRLALACAAALSLAHAGCNASCNNNPDDNPPEVYTAGVGDPVTETYESSPPNSGILAFAGGKQYLLVHHLGFTPATLEIDFGFDSNGDDLSHCAGNTCIHPCVNSEFIWIRNDSCADFLVRVVAMGRSNFQQGTLCPGGASISIDDAAVETIPPTPDSSEAQSPVPSPDASDESPAATAPDAATAE